ncbi:MAG TPA: cobalamin-dependent protein [Gemmatimonadaceae bacterium]|nr:cobalamin-dependent protein [Gemmatimonadaceae bacterium]
MNVLLVHPSSLRYAEPYLRLEPLGLECVAQSLCQHGHVVQFVDLQVSPVREFKKALRKFKPDAVGLALEWLASVPEAVDLAKLVKRRLPDAFVFIGGQAVSLVADEIRVHADGAIDAVVIGEGEVATPGLLETPTRTMRAADVNDISKIRPARDLTRHRNRYFIGDLTPCASIELSRGRRLASAEVVANELLDIREPNVFLFDDVAFAYTDHMMAVAEEIELRRLRLNFAAGTRAEIMLSNEDVFDRWVDIGLSSIFLRLASLEDEPRALTNRALEIANRFGLKSTVELVTDPSWDRADFARARTWAASAPATVHLTVKTPAPGDPRITSADYRLYDARHAVMATRMPLADFYGELVNTQTAMHKQAMGWRAMFKSRAARHAPSRLADHRRPVTYQVRRSVENKRGERRDIGFERHQQPHQTGQRQTV